MISTLDDGTFLLHIGDSKGVEAPFVATVKHFTGRDAALKAFEECSVKHKYLVSTEGELSKVPLLLLKSLVVKKVTNRQRLEREAWKAMTDEEKQQAKEAKKAADAEKKEAAEKAKAEKKAAADAKKAEADKVKAEKKAAAEAKKAEAEAKKAEAEKAKEAKKAEREAAKQAQELAKSRIGANEVITLLVEGNPKREGSESFKRFALYQNGMTVKQFLDAGGTMGDVTWDLGHRFIAIAAAA